MSAFHIVHERLATTVLLFMAAVGIWGIFSYLRGQSMSGSIAGALIIGQGLVVVQGLAGMVLFVNGANLGSNVHLLYGFTAALVLPFVWSYMRDRYPRQGLLLYSLIALFVAGLAIRGMTTGGS